MQGELNGRQKDNSSVGWTDVELNDRQKITRQRCGRIELNDQHKNNSPKDGITE